MPFTTMISTPKLLLQESGEYYRLYTNDSLWGLTLPKKGNRPIRSHDWSGVGKRLLEIVKYGYIL